jgi:hypothetical protein
MPNVAQCSAQGHATYGENNALGLPGRCPEPPIDVCGKRGILRTGEQFPNRTPQKLSKRAPEEDVRGILELIAQRTSAVRWAVVALDVIIGTEAVSEPTAT